MFSFLNFLNQGLNYFNFFNLGWKGNQILNRVYLILSILGNVYLFYVADRFIQNQCLIHGGLLFIAACGLVYLIYINVWYYFFDRVAPFDVSATINRKLGIKRRSLRAIVSPINEIQNLGSANAFRHGIPAKLVANYEERQNLNRIVWALSERRQIFTDYAGLKDYQINNLLHRNGNRPVYAIGLGIDLRHFQVKRTLRGLTLYINAGRFRSLPVGRIVRIGLQDVGDLQRRHQLKDLMISSVILVGGNYKLAGRSGIREYRNEYHLLIRVSRFS